MALHGPLDRVQEASTDQAARETDHQPIGREERERNSVRAINARLGGETGLVAVRLGEKSEHQLGVAGLREGVERGRVRQRHETIVQAPEAAGESGGHFPVAVPV